MSPELRLAGRLSGKVVAGCRGGHGGRVPHPGRRPLPVPGRGAGKSQHHLRSDGAGKRISGGAGGVTATSALSLTSAYFVATFFTSLISPDPVSISIFPRPSPIRPVI